MTNVRWYLTVVLICIFLRCWTWQIDGETVETVADLIFWGSKIGADMIAAMKLKMLTPWKESFDQPRQHIKKQRHYFVNTGLSGQGHHFSSSHIWMWEFDYKESWAQKNWCFWTWRRLLRVPWMARRSNQSILREISPECSLESFSWSWNCNTLDAWCEELTHSKRPWCWEGLKAGGEGDDRGWNGWMASPSQWR